MKTAIYHTCCGSQGKRHKASCIRQRIERMSKREACGGAMAELVKKANELSVESRMALALAESVLLLFDDPQVFGMNDGAYI